MIGGLMSKPRFRAGFEYHFRPDCHLRRNAKGIN
jgi:hypothetical protein